MVNASFEVDMRFDIPRKLQKSILEITLLSPLPLVGHSSESWEETFREFLWTEKLSPDPHFAVGSRVELHKSTQWSQPQGRTTIWLFNCCEHYSCDSSFTLILNDYHSELQSSVEISLHQIRNAKAYYSFEMSNEQSAFQML